MEMNHFQSECAGPLYSRNVHYPGSQMDAHISADMLSSSAQSTYSLSQNADDVAHGQLVHSVSTCSLSSEGIVVKAEPQEINGSNGVCMEVAVFEPGVGDSSSSASNRATCQVCGDKASGFHYGVTSCEGCKGFFRRSMSKQNDYRCLRGKGCQVMRTNRNRCQFCRFMKCLSVGMSRDSVRYGRVPKQPVSYEDQPVSSTGILELSNRQSEDALKRAKYDELHEIIMTLSHVHVLYCDETGDKVAAMEKIHSSLLSPPEVPNHQTQLPLNEIEACRCLMFQNAALLVNPTMYQVVEFAKRIPDFHLVSQDDQLTLIKSSFFEVCLVRTARLYDPVNGNVLFSSGGRIIRKAELEVVYGKALVDGMFDFAQRFTQFNLTDTEVGLVTCLILTNSDQPGVIDRETVKIIHNKLRDALHMLTAQTHPQEQTLFRSIVDQLPTLRDLNQAFDQQLEWYRSRWRHLHLPPLYAEIFDMPRPDDESENNESENH